MKLLVQLFEGRVLDASPLMLIPRMVPVPGCTIVGKVLLHGLIVDLLQLTNDFKPLLDRISERLVYLLRRGIGSLIKA